MVSLVVGQPAPRGSEWLRRRVLLGVVAAGATLALAACDDDPFGGARIDGEVAERQSYTSSVEFKAARRFNVALQLLDAPSLGVPLRVEVVVGANVPSSQGQLEISSPELQLAASMGGKLIAPPHGQPLPDLLNEPLSLQQVGQVHRRAVTLTISNPGYYRINATARAVAVTPIVSGRPVVSTVPSDLWVYVDETRGFVTTEFDATLVPDTVVAVTFPPRTGRDRIGGS